MNHFNKATERSSNSGRISVFDRNQPYKNLCFFFHSRVSKRKKKKKKKGKKGRKKILNGGKKFEQK